MKKLLVITFIATMLIATVGCARTAKAGIPEGEFIPSNSFEERVGRDTFDSYDEIIGLLKAPEGYAFVDIKGADEPVLVLAMETFGGKELGYNGALEAYPYLKGADGKVRAGSGFFTISTGTPIAVSDDGIVYCATHNTMTTLCIGENGTANKGIMCMKYVYTEYGEDGKPATFGGFVRTKNTVVNNDGKQIAENDEAAFKQAFAEYEKCTVIDFKIAK